MGNLIVIRRILLSLGAMWLICAPVGLSPPAMAGIQKDVQDCNQTVDLDRQIAGCTRAIAFPELRNIRGTLLSNRGNAWYTKGEYDRAIADYDESIRLDPKNPNPRNGRGLAWREKREFDRAIADFNEAIRLAPKFGVTYSNRGEVWRLKGDLDRALADQDQAVALDPKGPLVCAVRGDTLRYKGEFARAIADYEHALQNAPDHDYIPALTGLGLTYEKMGDLAKARTKLEAARDSRSNARFLEPPPSSLETARAQLAALDSGVAPPTIPISLSKATSATSIPTPVITVATVPAADQLPTALSMST